MNILFKVQEEYLIDQGFEHVRSQINNMTTEKWTKYGVENIIGELNSDNTFKFNQRLFQLNPSKPAYLTGIIVQNGLKTKLTISVRPNYLFVIVFYFLVVSFFLEMVGFETILKGSTFMNLITFMIELFILYCVMLYFRTTLKKRFEKQLKIDRKRSR